MSEDRSVGAVILAAGASRRYGSPKQLVVIDGRTLLEHAIEAAVTADLEPVVAVVPVWLPRPARTDSEQLRWVRNAFPERGMSLSLRLGFDALGNEVEAALAMLGDQGRIPAAMLAALLEARGDRPVISPSAGGILAPPILLERSHFHLVEGLTGDIGLREVLASNRDLVRAVPVASHVPDLDTPDDLVRISRP
ncbi:MAG: nucleotidyltransferase family protein [Chloroflexota bacterium]|nr:nucleotidyltransferase family protein [Chloroflexota bacterium]